MESRNCIINVYIVQYDTEEPSVLGRGGVSLQTLYIDLSASVLASSFRGVLLFRIMGARDHLAEGGAMGK